MPQTSTEMARQLRPFWGRLTVIESPVDEEQMPSGLIVPLHHEGEATRITRGVVIHIDQTYHDTEGQWSEYAKRVDTGVVVWFQGGQKVRDVWVVDISNILAYEEEAEA